MSKDIFKEIIPSLTQNNQYQCDNKEDENSYIPYLINKSLSAHIDIVLFANEMNLNPHLDKKLQYDFYFHVNKKYKRKYQPWVKYSAIDDIELIKEYYKCSTIKAEQYNGILNKEHINYIKSKLDKGGNTKINK